MHVLVVTVVHVPTDARILHRQIRALVDAGVEVTYAAPWTDTGSVPPDHIRTLDLPRASGRRRVAALQQARRLLRSVGGRADLVLLHDPELVAVVRGLRDLPPVVWDVHEDTAAALTDKRWLPGWAGPTVRAGVGRLERWADRNLHLILAEDAYRSRFTGDHPVIANHPAVPDDVDPPGDEHVVYLGRVSRGRGALELIELGRELAGEVTVRVIGAADGDVAGVLAEADRDGVVDWHGFVPNDEALPRLRGALAGLSLLADEPNYRSSMPTKIYEYLGWGVPAITTPLPEAERFVQRHEAGLVVPFGDVAAAAAAVRTLKRDPVGRRAMATRGRAAVLAEHSWDVTAPRFVELLRTWARPWS